MGFFASKIGITVLAGGTITLGGLGLLFTGSDTLRDASNYVRDSANKIVQYEENENILVSKIGTIKENAKADGVVYQERIATLENQKSELEQTVERLNGDVSRLNADVDSLKTSLEGEKADHEATRGILTIKVAELDKAKKDLEKAQKEIRDLNGTINWAIKKSKDADKLVTELEGEITKANAQVEAHGNVVNENKEVTKDFAPMTQDEIDAIDTNAK